MLKIKLERNADLIKNYIVYIAKSAGVFFDILIGLTIIQAITPFLQANIISSMLNQINSFDGLPYIYLVALGILTIADYCVSKISTQMSLQVQAKANTKAFMDLADYLKIIEPRKIVGKELQTEVEFSYQGLSQGKFVVPVASILSCLSLIIIYCELLFQLGFTEIFAALLMLLALSLQLIPLMRFGQKEQSVWPEEQRMLSRARYLEYQLSHYNDAQELSLFDARELISDKAINKRLEIMNIRNGLELFFAKDTAIASAVSVAVTLLSIFLLISSGVGIATLISAFYLIGAALMQNINSAYVLGEFVSCIPYMSNILSLRNKIDSNNYCESKPLRKIETIELRDIHFTYNNSNNVLNGIDVTLRKGQVVAIVGANGAGKTTLLSILLGLYKPNSGSIYIDGKPIDNILDVKHMFDIVLQDFGEFEIGITDFLSFGENYNNKEINEALELAGLSWLIDRLKSNPHLKLGEEWGGISLSGGQWQRLALARVFLRKHPIRILDEFTSNIDAEAEEDIFRTLKAQSDDFITVIVTHRAWTLKHADLIYVLSDGRIVESGTYSDLRTDGKEFNRIFSFQDLSECDVLEVDDAY